MSHFLPWFFEEFLPPLMPAVVIVAVVIEILFWGSVILGVGWLCKKILVSRKRRSAS